MEEICPTCGIELDGAVHDCSHREPLTLEKEVEQLTPIVRMVSNYLEKMEKLYF